MANIDVREYTPLSSMLANGWVIGTNGIDVKVVFAYIHHDWENDRYYSKFNKHLAHGPITHWKYP